MKIITDTVSTIQPNIPLHLLRDNLALAGTNVFHVRHQTFDDGFIYLTNNTLIHRVPKETPCVRDAFVTPFSGLFEGQFFLHNGELYTRSKGSARHYESSTLLQIDHSTLVIMAMNVLGKIPLQDVPYGKFFTPEGRDEQYLRVRTEVSKTLSALCIGGHIYKFPPKTPCTLKYEGSLNGMSVYLTKEIT